MFHNYADIHFGFWEHWDGFSKEITTIWRKSDSYKAELDFICTEL